MLVSELLLESGGWDWSKVNNVLWEVDRLEMKRLLGGAQFGDDKIVWHYTTRGVYTVRSGYYVAVQRDESSSNGSSCGFKEGLQKLWNLKLPNKIKIHTWRLIFEAIPVHTNLKHRGIEVDEICLSCKSYPEDAKHTFWYCKFDRKVWRNSDLWPCLIVFQGGGFGDLFQWMEDKGNMEE